MDLVLELSSGPACKWPAGSVTQSYPTLCDSTDCSPPGFSVHGLLQARILEWIAIPFFRASSWPRDRTQVSCIGRWILYHWVNCVFSQPQNFFKLQTPRLPTTNHFLSWIFQTYHVLKWPCDYSPLLHTCFSSKVPASLKGTIWFLMPKIKKNLGVILEASFSTYINH